MRKAMVMLVVMVSTVSISSLAIAAAWYVPTNVRIVQKSNKDTTGRIYDNIQTAIDSIGSAATASAPYLVKVMPGVYDLGAGKIQMKPYVTLEGSGVEDTIITSTIAGGTGGNNCSVGTVTMADNSTVRNIQVINTAPDLNGVYQFFGITINNVKASVEGVKVYVGSDTGVTGSNVGICFAGSSSDAMISNVTSEGHGSKNPAGIGSYGAGLGKATILNSRMVGVDHGPNSSGRGVDCAANEDASITIINSDIEASVILGDSPAVPLDGGTCNVSVSNSRIRATNISTGTGGGTAVSVGRIMNIINSEIYTSGAGVIPFANTNATTRIANTLVQGTIEPLADGAKMINCYDGNFDKIADKF